MPYEVTTNIQLLENDEVMPVQIWLDEGHGRSVWSVNEEETAQANSARLVPRSSDSLLADGLILLALMNWPHKGSVSELNLFDKRKLIDLTQVDFTEDQWQLIYESLGLDLHGVEVRVTYLTGSSAFDQVEDLNQLGARGHVAKVASFDDIDLEYVELWATGSTRVVAALNERREGPADKIQQDLDAVSFEEVAQLELNEDLDEEFEA